MTSIIKLKKRVEALELAAAVQRNTLQQLVQEVGSLSNTVDAMIQFLRQRHDGFDDELTEIMKQDRINKIREFAQLQREKALKLVEAGEYIEADRVDSSSIVFAKEWKVGEHGELIELENGGLVQGVFSSFAPEVQERLLGASVESLIPIGDRMLEIQAVFSQAPKSSDTLH